MIKRNSNNDSGASLVLVIVCILFVGIIAAAVLTLTTGNINSTKSSEWENDNFYGAESVLDGVKSYLQTIANKAATEAYAMTIDDLAAGRTTSINKTTYETHYTTLLSSYLSSELDTTGELRKILNDKSKYTEKFGIPAGVVSGVSIEIGAIYEDDNTVFSDNTLKNISIRFTDGNNYTTTIDTDLLFDCKMPEFSYSSARNEYKYNVDKYIIITDGNIKSNGVANDLVGNVYAGGNINLLVDGTLDVYSQYFISKGTVDIKKGKLTFSGLSNTNKHEFVDLEATMNDNKTVSAGGDDAEMWVGGIDLSGDGSAMDVYNARAKLYVKDDLSLNGKKSSFTIVNSGAEYYGMSDDKEYADLSSDNKTKASIMATHHTSSSGIIINGVGSTLDMSNAGKIMLPGTAYTQVPKIAGSSAADDCNYFVQGESITFKSLQSVYLVPGDKIIYTDDEGNKIKVGSNPFCYNDTIKLYGGKTINELITVDSSGVENLLPGKGYLISGVRYVSDSSQEYFYVFWDFKNTDAAVDYFNDLRNNDATKNRIKMLDTGKILLPEASKIYSKGAVVGYDGDSMSTCDDKNVLDDDDYKFCTDTLVKTYNKLSSSLDKKLNGSSENLFDTLFGNGMLDDYIPTSGYKDYPLESPLGHWGENGFINEWSTGTDTNEIIYTNNELVDDTLNINTKDGTVPTTDYYLVIGDVSEYEFQSDKKYIVISPDPEKEVKINGFNGIIFARGDVYIAANDAHNCLGNIKTTIKANGIEDTTVVMSEFDALLNRVVEDDSLKKSDGKPNGNTILRTIFGLAHGGASMVGSNGLANDIASIDTINYKKN